MKTKSISKDRKLVSAQTHEINYEAKKVAGKKGSTRVKAKKAVIAAKKALGRNTSRKAVTAKAKALAK